jgi:DNA-binding NtrC family response regulator
MATLTMSDELGALAPEVSIDLKSRLLAYERELISAALAESRGNQRRAAQRLGILPTTLHEKMKRLGLRADPFLPAGARGEAGSEAATRAQDATPAGEASL